jgi:hypothetical protein
MKFGPKGCHVRNASVVGEWMTDRGGRGAREEREMCNGEWGIWSVEWGGWAGK